MYNRNEELYMRPCGECTACCTWLMGSAFGHEFGNGKSCKFLCDSGCSVHKARPQTCMNYYCAWSQGLLPDEWRPDKIDVLVSVENKNNQQYLKVIGINNKEINIDILSWLREWSKTMQTPVIYSLNQEWKVL